jgi:hypothetical protein
MFIVFNKFAAIQFEMDDDAEVCAEIELQVAEFFLETSYRVAMHPHWHKAVCDMVSREEYKSILLELLTEHGEELCMDMYGCEVIRRCFDSEQLRNAVLESLLPNIIRVACSAYGSILMQHFIYVSPEIHYELRTSTSELSMHLYGKRVVSALAAFPLQ